LKSERKKNVGWVGFTQGGGEKTGGGRVERAKVTLAKGGGVGQH